MGKHKFVLTGTGIHLGWWLQITSVDELIEYQDKHSGKYGRALLNILRDKELGADTCTHGPYIKDLSLSQAAYYHAINQSISPVASLMSISYQTSMNQLDALQKHGAIYINSVGGWNWSLTSEVKQYLWKDDFVFPNFTKDDIRVSKFPGGTHYYAHVGPMEVRDGDTVKWFSYDEAYRHAAACIS